MYDYNKCANVVDLDISKAFDKAPPKRQISKLYEYNIN